MPGRGRGRQPPAPRAGADDEGMGAVATQLAQELAVSGVDGAYVVARTLGAAVPKWVPATMAQLVVQLYRALMAQQVEEEEVLVMVAAVAGHLSKDWESKERAQLLSLLTSMHGWSVEGKGAAAVLMFNLMTERGLLPGTNEAVEDVAALAAELAQAHGWHGDRVGELVGALLPSGAWDPSGMRGLCLAHGGALLVAALSSRGDGGFGWSVPAAAALLPQLAPRASWDGALAGQLCAELVGSFGLGEQQAADAVRAAVGWEAASVETATELAARLHGPRYRWRLPEIADLLLALKEGGDDAAGEAAATADAWDATELSQLADALRCHGWEVAAVAELLGEFPLALDMDMAADLVGALDWPIESTAELLDRVLSLTGRPTSELASFVHALHVRHGWPVGEVATLLRNVLGDENPYISANVGRCAELSGSLESTKEWSQDELADLLCGLQLSSEGEMPPVGQRSDSERDGDYSYDADQD